MSQIANQLLKRLEPAVRPDVHSVGGARPQSPSALRAKTPFELQSFDQLLSLASTNAMHSGRQVEIKCELDPPLDAAQLERLAFAADRAEAAGAQQALMLIDGRGVIIDIASRAIVGELTGTTAEPINDIDAALFVPRDEHSSVKGIQLPGNGLLPPAVFKQLQLASLMT